MTKKDKDLKKNMVCPVVPLRNIVVLPGMIVPLFIGRIRSLKAIEAAEGGSNIFLVAQQEVDVESPKGRHLYDIGVVGNVLQVLKMQDSTIKVLIEGTNKAIAKRYIDGHVYCKADITVIEDEKEQYDEVEVGAIMRAIMAQFETYIKMHPRLSNEIIHTVSNITDPLKYANTVCAHMVFSSERKQIFLEIDNIKDKLEKLLLLIDSEIELLDTEKRVKSMVKNQMDKNQKDYYLNEQLKAIHKELGEEDTKDDLNDIRDKIKKNGLSPEAKEEAMSELKKLRLMNPVSSEATVVRNYLDWIVNMPWSKESKINESIEDAEKVLDQNHYGLSKIKERVTEYLAVNLRTNNLRGPIMCLVGAPGVGKTSLAKSIADATGRKFAKISLAGLRDEAEIRGHRKTYVGAMPGKIIQAIKKAGVNNPLILLDEIDKIVTHDFRGDPSSTLLEALDEQNNKFNDHYLGVNYDISNVMFIATANDPEGIPLPLWDRMEIIRLSGYTEEEKMEIAKSYVLPKQMEDHGLEDNEITVSDDSVQNIIRYYTRESGVRSMNREIATICRKVVKEIMCSDKRQSEVTIENLQQYLGVHKYEFQKIEKENIVGITNGLSYSTIGGSILPVEVALILGKGGDIKLTGNLGDVIKESMEASLSYVRSRSTDFGIKPTIFRKHDFHIHLPAGAVPKDGPSAGIAICTSLVSALTKIPVRRDVAMTGEISLRGLVMPIGGLKEKLLGALQAGIKTALIPKDNVKDLEEMPDNIKNNLNIVPVETVEEALREALEIFPTAIKWDDDEEQKKDEKYRNEILNNIMKSSLLSSGGAAGSN